MPGEATAQSFQTSLFNNKKSEQTTFADFCYALGMEDGPDSADRFGEALKKRVGAAIQRPIKTLSLFSGAGGLDIGFHDAGFSISTAIEIDPRFAATLQSNSESNGYLSGTKVFCEDIRNYFPNPSESYDFIIGGPPCQTFSAAGRRAAGVQGTSDARGMLFKEYVRLLKHFKPKGFLFENVYGIVGANGGEAWKEIRQSFEDAGYRISYRILDAADYGVPQHRERLFIVGTKKDFFEFPIPTHGPDSLDNRPYVTAFEVMKNIASDGNAKTGLNGRYGYLLKDIPPGLNYSFYTEKMGHPEPIFAWRSKFSDFLYKADPYSPTRTLKAQGGQYTGPFHWENRGFSLVELKRIQTIPDKYTLVGNRQAVIHQIGNSVPPQVARVLAICVLEQIFNVSLSASLPALHESEQLGFRKRKRQLTDIYRTKAHGAIEQRNAVSLVQQPKTRSYHANLSKSFDWVPLTDSGDFHVVCKFTNDEWSISVGKKSRKFEQPAFEIILAGSGNYQWALKSKTVRLSGSAIDPQIFTAVWKAFEFELCQQSIKADLVQLCEYYQYTPKFAGKMHFARPVDAKWAFLGKVVEGHGVRKILTSRILAETWGIDDKKILGFAEWLRKLGYEIRNNNTNPQIPKDCFLVPYFFPTLAPLSVQLRKKLGNTDEQ